MSESIEVDTTETSRTIDFPPSGGRALPFVVRISPLSTLHTSRSILNENGGGGWVWKLYKGDHCVAACTSEEACDAARRLLDPW
jgi:hypothetical protein